MLPQRFFLVMWAVATLGGVVISAGTELSRRQQAQTLEPLVRNVLRLSVQDSAAVLATDGAANLKPARQRRDEDALPYLVVFDARGRVVHVNAVDYDRRLVGTVGAWVEAGAADRARRGGRLETETAGDTLLASRVVDGPGGESYLIVAASPTAIGLVGASPGEMFVRLVSILLLVTVSCVVAARYARGPLRAVRDATRRLADGDLSVRVPPAFAERGDDAGEMVRALNHMADRMEAVVETQRRMLRDISHELRSPLARLLIAVELARKSLGTRAVPPLDRIERDVSRMNELIGDLLTLGRFDTALGPDTRQEVDLKALVLDIVEDVRPEASVKSCSLAVGLPHDECIVVGYENMIRSAVENVVRNAIEHNPRQAVVDVTLHRAEKLAELVVSDQGSGVPAGDLERIFEPFYRVDGGRERSTGGSGLGLAIARRVMQAHGGTIHATNNPDGGLAVTMRLVVDGHRETDEFSDTTSA